MPDDRRSVERRGFLALCGAAVLGGCASSPESGDGSSGETTTDRTGSRPSTTTTGATATTTSESPSAGTTTGETTTGETPSGTTTTARPGITTGGRAWRMHGGGPRNAGVAATGGPVADPTREWAVDIEGIYTVSAPAVADGQCFTASGSYAYAVEVAGGDRSWRTALDYPGHHYSPAVVDDRVLVAARTMQGARGGGGEGALYALGVADGSERWRFDGPVSSPPTVADGAVYVTTSGEAGVVHALDPGDGTERWRFEFAPENAQGSAFSAPAVAGDTVYVTTTADRGDDKRGYLYALSAADGSVRWRYGADAECRAAAVVHDDTVYVATTAGSVHAVEAGGERRRWRGTTDREVYTTPAVTDDGVYVLAKGDVVAFDRASGDRRWSANAGVSLINGVTVAGDTVYTGGTNLTALATGDGSVRWQYPVPDAGGGFGAPSVVNGVVYVVICIKHSSTDPYDDELYAIR